MKTIDNITKQLSELQHIVAREYKANIIGIFGSYVRGEQKSGSDIDVLVEFQKGATLFDFSGLYLFLKERLGTEVDVVPIDTIRREIKQDILREVVYL